VSVEKGDVVKVNVVDIGSKGEGICKYNDFTIFVQGVVPGDILETEITSKKKSYANGKIVKILSKSEIRQNPECEYFDVCGGCQIQNIKYAEQLKYKTNKVKNAIERIGKIENVEVYNTIGMEEPYNYRNKGQFPIKKNNNKIEIGFYKVGTHEVVDLKKCIIQEEISNKVLNVVRGIINDNKISAYNESSHKGILRHVVIRTAYQTKDTMVILVTNGRDLPHIGKIITKLKEISEVKSIIQNVNKQRGNKVLGSKNYTIYGDDFIVDDIKGISFKVSPSSFFQINPKQTEILYEKTLEYAELTGEETVFDLYCGIGSISLFLAKKAKKVYGVEVFAQSVRDAKRNAKNNGIENVEFLAGKAEEIIPKIYKNGIKADVVVLDPPRKGCEARLLETIIEMKPKKIVYVSCKPATLARDLKYFVEHGYEVGKIQPVDMFPHSTHVETVCSLKRSK
jgi:23S rRNA (uracil1939-C5)-methyltransferase